MLISIGRGGYLCLTEDGCENNIMIDRDAGGEREELDPETVVSSSSDSFNFYKRCAWYVLFTIVNG